MSITRTAWTDDDGSGTTGTIINNAEKTTLYDQIDGRWSEATITSTGTQNNLTYSEADVIRCNNASDLTLTGITAPASPAKPGKRLVVVSVGAGNVFLAHQSGSSTAANRIINFATSANTPLAAGSGVAVLVYDDTTDRWRLVSHEQGAWITATFADADYTGSGGADADWAVDSGDIVTAAYRLSGRTLGFMFGVGASTVANTPAHLRRTVPGGFTIAKSTRVLYDAQNNGGAFAAGLLKANASATVLEFYSTLNEATAWVNGTNNNSVYGQVFVEVT